MCIAAIPGSIHGQITHTRSHRLCSAVEVLEKVDLVLVVVLDGLTSRFPVGRANLMRVRARVLERLENAQSLVHTATDSVIVDLDRTDRTFRVDDEQTAQRRAVHLVVLVCNQHAIVLRDAFADVGNERNIHLAQSAFVARRAHPGQMSVVRVRRDGHNLDTKERKPESLTASSGLFISCPTYLSIDAAEGLDAVAKAHNLRGAHERKVERVEEQNEPFACPSDDLVQTAALL